MGSLPRSTAMMTTKGCWRQTAAANTVSLGQYFRERVWATAGHSGRQRALFAWWPWWVLTVSRANHDTNDKFRSSLPQHQAYFLGCLGQKSRVSVSARRRD